MTHHTISVHSTMGPLSFCRFSKNSQTATREGISHQRDGIVARGGILVKDRSTNNEIMYLEHYVYLYVCMCISNEIRIYTTITVTF